MNVLVTGATGFIGKQLVRGFLDAGYGVCCTLLEDEANPFDQDSVASAVLKAESISDFVVFLQKQQVDGVLHLASMVQSGNHLADQIPALINANITFGTLLMEASVQAGVKWLVHTGTYWQHYGNRDYSPVNLYAATKQAFSVIAQYYTELYSIKFCTLTLFDTYGPGDPRPKIFSLWDRIANTGETLAMSPGEQIIDISYTGDIVNAFLLLSVHLQSSQQIHSTEFVVRANRRYSLRELAEIFEKVRGVRLNIEWGAKPYREREVMDPYNGGVLVPGWHPKVSLEEGIRKMTEVNTISKQE